MGRENFCLQCEHMWHTIEADHCPECGSEDVSTQTDWDDGHYEGDMAGWRDVSTEIED